MHDQRNLRIFMLSIGHRRCRVEDALAPREGGHQRVVVEHVGFEEPEVVRGPVQPLQKRVLWMVWIDETTLSTWWMNKKQGQYITTREDINRCKCYLGRGRWRARRSPGRGAA